MEGNKKQRGPYGKRQIEKRTSTTVDKTDDTVCIAKQLKVDTVDSNVGFDKSVNQTASVNEIKDTVERVSSGLDSEPFYAESNIVFEESYSEDTEENNQSIENITANLCDALYSQKGDFATDTINTEYDAILESLLEDAKLRNSDVLLSDEEDVSVDNDTEFIEEFETFVNDDVESCAPKTDDSNVNKDRFSSPLFEGSPHTLGIVVLLICCFVIRFRLPDEAISYLLRFLVCILPLGHTLIGSLYHFRKTIKLFSECLIPTLTYHCNSCYEIVDKNQKTCHSCGASMCESGARAYFMQLKIVSQLQTLWKNREFCDMVRTHRFRHIANNKTNRLSDIYDGLLYRRLFDNNGVLSDINNLSLSMNTDGAPLFKSSSISIWPVYMLINELPIAQRKKRNHALFYGVWISCKKPQMWSFLRPLFKELKALGSDGQTFSDFYGNEFDCKCFLLTCTCDLPARAIVYNCNQFNGEYSCWFCLQRGQTYRHESGGTSHIFPYSNNASKGPPRTEKSIKEDVDTAIAKIKNGDSKTTVRGHKGKFWFLYLENFDPVYSCVIDYMHGVCLGVCKLLLTLWFDKKHKDQDFSFTSRKKDVNTYLNSIKPTLYVTRIPKSLEELTHWKSSEYRNFLLYWGIPALRHVLTNEYFVHFCLLARAVFLLSKEGITDVELQVAESALLLFVENFSALYSERYMTLNIHQLVHLTDCVRHTGPLYVNNCFIFEDLNGFIIKHIHGTQGVDTQITNIVSMLKVPPVLYERFLKHYNEDEEILSLYHELSDTVTGRYKHVAEIEDGIRPMGNAALKKLSDADRILLLRFGVTNQVVKTFDRINMYKKGFYVYGMEYRRLKKRQQHVISYRIGDEVKFGCVRCFIQSEEQQQNRVVNLAQVEILRKVQPVGCVWQVDVKNDTEFIPIHSILNINNYVIVADKKYVCPSPNRYDRD